MFGLCAAARKGTGIIMKKIQVRASTEYEVLISSGILCDSGELMRQVIKPCRVLLVSDDKVFGLYGARAKKSLEEAGYEVSVHIFKNGEKSKTMQEYIKILEAAAEAGLTRTDAMAALGGGVTGDMTGFAAATYLRGIKFVQLPTTFLAAVDSSVGGKTGVNLEHGKNLAGAFHQPSLVVCDTDTFATLDDRTFADGTSETIKCGMICDAELFGKMSGDFRKNIEDIAANCVAIKRDVVCEDEFDTGKRQLLNFGHTIGHAIEKCSDFEITHGHAVAIGMAAVTRAAEKLGICEKGTADTLCITLKKCSLPTECAFSAKELYGVMLSDKKRAGNTITLVVPKKIGECVLHKIPVGELLNFVEKGLEK